MPTVSIKKNEGYGSFFFSLLQDSKLNMSQEYVWKIYENPGLVA